jgi:hypothetical protein
VLPKVDGHARLTSPRPLIITIRAIPKLLQKNNARQITAFSRNNKTNWAYECVEASRGVGLPWGNKPAAFDGGLAERIWPEHLIRVVFEHQAKPG